MNPVSEDLGTIQTPTCLIWSDDVHYGEVGHLDSIGIG